MTEAKAKVAKIAKAIDEEKPEAEMNTLYEEADAAIAKGDKVVKARLEAEQAAKDKADEEAKAKKAEEAIAKKTEEDKAKKAAQNKIYNDKNKAKKSAYNTD
jgi:colicin import membrane protein